MLLLRDEGAINERESCIDATFAAAKGGGEAIGLTKRGKGVKILAIVDRQGPAFGTYTCRQSSCGHPRPTEFRLLPR